MKRIRIVLEVTVVGPAFRAFLPYLSTVACVLMALYSTVAIKFGMVELGGLAQCSGLIRSQDDSARIWVPYLLVLLPRRTQ